MTKGSKIWGGVLASVCTFAFAAAPALATEFTASSTGATRGVGVGVQTFKFKPITIKCQKATSTGAVTALLSTTLADEVNFAKCTAFGTPVKFVTPVDFQFESDGAVQITNTVEIKVKAIKCLITIEPQAFPKFATKHMPYTFTNKVEEVITKKFPTGQSKLLAAGKIGKHEGISYSLSGGLCSELEEQSGEEGTYSGQLLDEVVGGNLGV